jgi:hypothetical protein
VTVAFTPSYAAEVKAGLPDGGGDEVEYVLIALFVFTGAAEVALVLQVGSLPSANMQI